jgi:hypothetical protein
MSDGPRQSCTWRTRRTHDELSPLPWYRPSASWWATIRDRGAAQGWPPALGRTALPGGEPSHPGSRSGRRPSHGDGGRPRGVQPNAGKNLSASQAEPALGGALLEQHGSMLSSQLPGGCGQRRQERTEDVGGNRRWLDLQLPDLSGRDRELGFKSPTWLPRALQALAHEAVVTEDGASPSDQGRANGATVGEGHPHRPCHKRAIHSGPERSRADNHGAASTCAVLCLRR